MTPSPPLTRSPPVSVLLQHLPLFMDSLLWYSTCILKVYMNMIHGILWLLSPAHVWSCIIEAALHWSPACAFSLLFHDGTIHCCSLLILVEVVIWYESHSLLPFLDEICLAWGDQVLILPHLNDVSFLFDLLSSYAPPNVLSSWIILS